MSNVVFLLGSYYPDFSAVGYCAYQVHKCLRNEYDICVLAFRNDPAQSMEEVHEGIRIVRLETADMKQRNALKIRKDKMAKACMLMHRARGAVRKLLSPETVDRALVRAYMDKLNSMTPKPRVVVPLVFPFETVLAALEYKKANPDVQIIPYLFDDFVDSGSLHVLKTVGVLKRRRHLRLEQQMLEEAHAILAMHPLRKHFESNYDKCLLDKLIFLEHPLLSRPHELHQRCAGGAVRLCFTGSLIRRVREPDYLLALLRQLRVNISVFVDFYVMGNGACKVRTETVGDFIHIENHGRVQKYEADQAVRNADILINIGEVKGRQISSKIFEYMSTGKPIIHLAYVEDDAVSRILNKYPLSCTLVMARGQLTLNAHRIGDFIQEAMHKQLTFDEIKQIYPEAMPDATSSILVKLMACEPPKTVEYHEEQHGS
jgi:glycosyltransferase involved in cell wall biosynthesis